MHASRTANSSMLPDAVMACFQFIAIGCYAAPKGCCPEVARRFTGLEFDVSEYVHCLWLLNCAAQPQLQQVPLQLLCRIALACHNRYND